MSIFNPEQEFPSIVAPRVEIQDVLKWVYLWMGLGLLLTALVAVFTLNTPALLSLLLGPGLWVAFIGQLALVLVLSAGLMRLSPAAAGLLFLGYAALNGFTLSGIFLAYAASDIVAAFLSASALFGAMTVVGFTTQMDLMKWGTYLFIGLIGVVIAMVINIFLGSSMLDIIISIVAVLIFTGLTAYDTQRIKRMAEDPEIRSDGSLTMKLSILGALRLYLDFINMFLYLLRLISRR